VAALSGGYDARGNLTNDGTRAFSYDVENRLLTAALPGVSASLSYDPLGRLASYTVNGTATQFLYLGSDLVGEYDGGWNLLRRYAHSDGVDEPLVWYEGAGTAGRRYLHADRQGSIIAWSDNNGAVQATYAYGPYGEPQGWSGSRFRYTGQIALPELQLYHYKARVYDPIAGRFLQTDPIGYKDGPDWYLYVGDDPLDKADPTGEAGEPDKPNQEKPPEANTCSRVGSTACSGDYQIAGGSGYSPQKPTNSVSEGRRRIAEEQRTNGPERDKQLLKAAGAIIITGLGVGAAAEIGVAATAEEGVAAEEAAAARGSKFCCFVAGTLVDTKSGLRPIEAIRVGDLVLSRDAVTGRTAYKPVAELIHRHDREIYRLTVQVVEQGVVRTDVFETTDDHPWRTAANEWRRTVDLRPGDLVQRSEGAPALVVSVEHTTRTAQTYNLEVADFHSYFVGDGRLWVHNSGCSEDPPPPYKVGGPKPDPLKGTRSSTGAPPPRAPPKKEEHWLVKLIRMINKAEETAAHH
jgi:RHS repeat-associated protein